MEWGTYILYVSVPKDINVSSDYHSGICKGIKSNSPRLHQKMMRIGPNWKTQFEIVRNVGGGWWGNNSLSYGPEHDVGLSYHYESYSAPTSHSHRPTPFCLTDRRRERIYHVSKVSSSNSRALSGKTPTLPITSIARSSCFYLRQFSPIHTADQELAFISHHQLTQYY